MSHSTTSRSRRSGQAIDVRRWKRRAHYELFKTYQQPFFGLTVDLDVTGLWSGCKKPHGPSFYLTSLFVMLGAVNATEALRMRLRPRGVWLHDRVGIGAPILKPDETYAFVRFEANDDFTAFLADSGIAIARAASRRGLALDDDRDDVVYQSALPWIRFTSFSNALPGNDSIPRIAFGRCVRQGRRMKMPVAIEVHHALVDGLDVARFLDRLQNAASAFRFSRQRQR